MSKFDSTLVSATVSQPGRWNFNSTGIPYSTARSRSTTSPLSGSVCWGPAELYLTDTKLCYEIEQREGQVRTIAI